MKNFFIENISFWELVGGIVAIIILASLIRLIAHAYKENRKVLQNLTEKHRKETDDFLDEKDAEIKAQFKKDIFDCYKNEQLKNMERLKRKILQEVLLEQSKQFEKLKRAALMRIIRKVISEFRSRFFKNLQQALIAQAQKKKGQNAKLNQMQKEAIFEVENRLEEKSQCKAEQKERQEKEQQKQDKLKQTAKENEKKTKEIEKLTKLRKEIEKERNAKEKQLDKQKAIENNRQERERQHAQKPIEIQKASIQAGYNSGQGKSR